VRARYWNCKLNFRISGACRSEPIGFFAGLVDRNGLPAKDMEATLVSMPRGNMLLADSCQAFLIFHDESVLPRFKEYLIIFRPALLPTETFVTQSVVKDAPSW
jgi:hypothetical protein